MASSYYNSSGKEVFDGDIAYADDLNAVNNAVDSAFQLVETAVTAVGIDAAANAAQAATSATNAATSATNAATSATNASNSASSASTSASSASSSASSATSSASSASTSASTATTKAALAEKWAEETEDVQVTTGKYSAKHWAAKAQASAGLQTITGTGVDNTDPNNPVITITKSTISLSNVDNTSDANKPVSTATQTALNLKANLSSPTFTGTPAAPTATVGTNTTQIATTAFVLANQTPAPSFFHAQDRKAYNVDGGSSVADTWTKRTLNTEVYNDMGVTLSSNEVSLPAGTYFITGSFSRKDNTGTGIIAGIAKDGSVVLQGITSTVGGSVDTSEVSGMIVLAAPAAISLVYYSGLATATTGLGASNNSLSITDASIPSIYADLKVWQLSS